MYYLNICPDRSLVGIPYSTPPKKWFSVKSLCTISEEMSKGESIFRGAGITVEDEFTNDNFDEEEEAGEGWIEEGHEVREWKETNSPFNKISR